MEDNKNKNKLEERITLLLIVYKKEITTWSIQKI